MTIKLLNKHLTSFLTQPFAENFINAFKYNKSKRVKRLGKKSLNEGVANVVSKNVGLTSTIKNPNTQTNLDSSNSEQELSNFSNLQSFKGIKVPSDYLYGPKSSSSQIRSGKSGGTDQMLYFIKGEGLSIDMKKAENQIIRQFFENKLSTSVLGTKSTQGKTEAQASIPFLHPKKNTFHPSRSDKRKMQVGINTQNGLSSDKLNLLAVQDLNEYVSDPERNDYRSERNSFSTTSVMGMGIDIAPHFLFSLDQIRSEKVEQARFTSSIRTQNKNDSEFKKQLRECKKIRLLYGHLSKRDLKKSLAKVQRLQGFQSENLLLYLETRLDVILERCGFFPTIRAARQSILHGRIQVNFKVIKVPSYQLKAGNIIKVNLSKSNCVKIHSYPKIKTRTTSPKPNYFSGVIQSNTSRLNYDQQTFKVDYLDLNSVPTKFKKDIINFSRSLKKTTSITGQLLSFFIRFLQTHLYFQSLFSLLSFFKNKKNSELKMKINVEEQPPFRQSATEVPSMSSWRFSIPPYALSSILEIQCMLYEKSVQSKYLSVPTSDSSTLTPNTESTESIETVTASKMMGYKHPFINVFHYWLEIKKKLLYPRSNFWGETYSIKSNSILPSESEVNEINTLSELPTEEPATEVVPLRIVESSIDKPSIQTSFSKNKKEKANILYPSIQTNYLQKESKPLHLEISYSSLCAIFLFPPQQIYFPATVDLDLITKLTGIKSK